MAADRFNSIGGYSTGIPPINVIDANGNIVTNVNAPNANITANRVFANEYLYANGISIITTAAGTNTQVQFNNAGNFGASPGFTFNSASNLLTVTNVNVSNVANLGNVENVRILGGDNGYFLQTDGTGNLTWANAGGGGGNGSPGGANMQVQYNNAGTFGGDAGFTYDKDTNVLTVPEANILGNVIAGNADLGNLATANYMNLVWDLYANVVVANYLYGDGSNITNVTAAHASTANTVVDAAQPNITSVGNLTSLVVVGNGTFGNVFANTGLIKAQYFQGDGSNLSNINGSNVTGTVANATHALTANTVTTAAQPNITSVGTLTGLTVTGNAGIGNISTGGLISTGNITVTSNANIAVGGVLRSFGDVNFAQSPNVSFGNIANIHIPGGINGYVLTTDGAGNLSWAAGGGGGNGTPGGSNTQIQFNDNGVFGGSTSLTFNKVTNAVNVAGNLTANTFQIGSGVYKFSSTYVYFATTNSAAPNQIILSIPVDDLAGTDITIISTDPAGNIRNLVKMSAVVLGTVINYVEHSTLPVGGYVGDFNISYDPGNVVVDASLVLTFSPQSANLMTHKMQITSYQE